MSLSAFSLKFKSIMVALVTLLMLWGILSYLTMPRREDPEYTVRTCQVLTNWPGTSAEKIEELITEPIEEEVNTLDGIRWVRSETSMGRSAVYVELDRPTPGAAVEQMWDKVRSRVKRVPMPEPDIKPVVIDDFGDTNIMIMALYQTPVPGDSEIKPENRYSHRELDIFSERLKDEVKLLTGVAKVVRTGVHEEALYIETDLGTWTQLSLTTSQLEELVSQRNVVAPGGIIDTGVGRFTVKPSGDIDATRELNSIIVGTIGDEKARVPVYLDDLNLEVVRAYRDPPEVITRYSDPHTTETCVIVAFTMKKGANIVDVCANAKNVVHKLTAEQKILPPDIAVSYITDQSETVTRKISDFIWNVVGAVVIVVAVVYLMVGFRSAAVMGANIPLVIIGSLAIITVFGVQMEQISLAAMIIALGMLVDNAVQICDQTRRLQSEGMSPLDAALNGANQLSFPILIATGTTIAAFYPMLIGLQGATYEYIYSLPVTLTVTLAFSYILAMTFCVLLAYWFIRPPKDPNQSMSPIIQLIQWSKQKLGKGRNKTGHEPAKEKEKGRFTDLYPNIARICIKARFIVIAVSFSLLFIVMTLPVGSEFFPQDQRDQFAVEVWLPEGVNIQQADYVTKSMEGIIRKLSPYTDEKGNKGERLLCMASVIGKGCDRWYLGRNPESSRPNYAEIVVKTTNGLVTSNYVKDIRRIAREGDTTADIEPVTGARIIPRELVMGPSVDAPIGIRIFGPRLGVGFADLAIMRELADGLTAILRKQPGTWDNYDTWGSSAYQLHIDVDENKANLSGVTNLGLAQTLNAYFSGHYLTTFREGDHLIPVYLRLPPEQRGSIEELRSAYVEGKYGKVPLDSIAEILPRWKAARIDRRFLQRVIEVRARVEPGYRANDIVMNLLASDEFKQWETNLPPGYWWEAGGELFESKQAKSELSLSLGISLLMIILLLIIQYNGFAKPVIILTTLPLALIGSFFGLYITGNPLGFMPQLGLLALFGIVVNTAIIFIEFADILIKKKIEECDGSGPIMGMSIQEFRECLVQAGQVRLLPIAMTTLTTIGGLLPLALAGGPLWEGMAWLMIFGLIVATILTLIVVPSLYAIFVENFKMKPVTMKAPKA
ncbi:MAG: efflux RND transporter permease subunit [Candidatus Scalindua rubra]|uniref:Multicomponent efflux pump (Cytoplasmic membrane subunit, RND type ABC transporters) n=1 Tax=Candidatus Scalindua brodae TaxID=237368 RepID=A0A0B0EIC9_9BACT|nr:MAG: multicomponent efflux pump (cytoplasmic membrane subunit, RND type ABC transporters) [Candidatus Scalindua brodae]MBZ0109591.1 efflux RND transporter permease subunit [Candidatus Scalindua rubra]TWU33155.1 Toluene efflux pump membrane transporter TtgH [Candidatus Brocadiaceae bacterium S225]